MSLDRENTERALLEFTKYVVSQARANLTRMKINSSGKLSQSLVGNVQVMPNSIKVSFPSKEYQEYGIFRDKGVSGIKKKYNTPFKYTNKRPPTRKLDSWIVKKGQAPRDKKGKFLSRKSQAFALASKIYRDGIKPTGFFTNPFEKGFERLPDIIAEAYGLDVEKFLKFVFKK